MAVIDANALITLADLKNYLGVTGSDEDGMLTAIANRASAFVESFCDRKFVAREYYEWHDGTGQKELLLRNLPVVKTMLVAHGVQPAITVSSSDSTDLALLLSVNADTVSVDRIASNGSRTESSISLTTHDTASELVTQLNALSGVNATLVKDCPSQWLHRLQGRDVATTSVDLTFPPDGESEYRVFPERGQISLRFTPLFYGEYPEQRHDRFPRTQQSILVWYKAGYSSIPYDVVQATLEVGSAFYSMRSHDPNVTQESLGDYSYSLRLPQETLDAISVKLGPYRKVI